MTVLFAVINERWVCARDYSSMIKKLARRVSQMLLFASKKSKSIIVHDLCENKCNVQMITYDSKSIEFLLKYNTKSETARNFVVCVIITE